jgi:hypothetical protein
MTASARRYLVATVGATALTIILAACGSGANSTATQPPAPRLSPVKVARGQVTNMVLNTGDLPGFTLHSDGPETLKDQLPPKGLPHFAAATRIVRANWLASQHSIVISADGRVPLLSDANLFKSASAAKRIWQLEQLPPPGTRLRRLPKPAGLPQGSDFFFLSNGHHGEVRVDWREGNVIAYVALGAHSNQKFTRIGMRRIATFLATAARAEYRRVQSAQGWSGTV